MKRKLLRLLQSAAATTKLNIEKKKRNGKNILRRYGKYATVAFLHAAFSEYKYMRYMLVCSVSTAHTLIYRAGRMKTNED